MNYFIKTLSFAGRRACALLLCTVMVLGMLPVLTPAATAANTQQDWSLNRLVSWDIMRGDLEGNLEPERAITRAEFVSMLNRTFGYTQTGAQPFRDVRVNDWFYDDISIAYTAGYFQGTSRSTASPDSTLTREEAATMLCRNLMLRPLSGEDLSFTDSRQASSWSRGYIKAAAEEGILRGDPDGSFRPLDNITRGEVAMMLVRVIGTPIQEPGTYSNSVSGNLMINTSGVTLENMVITGDLYITAGVGQGYVTLNNVTVYGKIIASGSGESNQGDCSIILKNCTAPEMIVDSPSNQYVTIRSVGETEIDRVSVRTDAYLENRSIGDYGFQLIELDGEEGSQLDLAGNIHEVITITPNSEINIGSGSVDELTVDEAATGSTVHIAQGAVVHVMNLDTATTVTGEGDIGTLNVNAEGCVVEMLPDIIVIRPGITANINGIVMDSTLAEQMSDTPRLLSGYPRVDDIAPTQVRATFRTNKPGTVYWAVRLSGDGAFSASDLIDPPTYGANIIKSGNLQAANANEDLVAQINGLEVDTSYVLSAVLVDARDDQSIVKNVYFTTPDNSRPAFASGYPRAVTIEDTYVDFDVAATKNCTLYWAIYPSGMPAPTANEFKDGSLSGAIDSGDRRVERSVEDSIRMGSVNELARNALEELTDYDAYFFLTDGINESNVVRVSVTTADRTPPEFLENFPRITGIDRTSLDGQAAINEDGEIFWAAVTHGTTYPIPSTSLTDPDAIELDKKLQIQSGMYAVANGSFNANANTQTDFTMNGLQPETAYDIYFVAEDTSGNLSVIESIENAKTLDQNAPALLRLEFSDATPDPENPQPLASTDITLVFSEDIYNRETRLSLVDMYQDWQEDPTITFQQAGGTEELTWEQILTGMFELHNLDLEIPDPAQTLVAFDINNVEVMLNDEGQTEVTFRNEAFDPDVTGGLGLQSGTTYQFVLNNIVDSSTNVMPNGTTSDEFTILDAQVNFYDLGEVTLDPDSSAQADIIDAAFSMVPYGSSLDSAPENAYYDLIIGSDTSIQFKLYRRDYNAADKSWTQIPSAQRPDGAFLISHSSGADENNPIEWTATTYNLESYGTDSTQYKPLTSIEDGYEYAIHITSIGGETARDKWNATINLSIYCVTGTQTNLRQLVSQSLNDQTFASDLSRGTVTSIGNPSPYTREIRLPNQSAPQFIETYPRAQPGDSVTTIQYQLDRDATLYYVVAPVENLPPVGTNPDGTPIEDDDIANIGDPNDYNILPSVVRDMGITQPHSDQIMNPSAYYNTSDGFRYGSQAYRLGGGLSSFQVQNLEASSWYYIYFVLQGSYNEPSPVMCYKFNTADVQSPLLSVFAPNSTSANYTVRAPERDGMMNVETHWMLYQQGSMPELLEETMSKPAGIPLYEALEDDSFNTTHEDDQPALADGTTYGTLRSQLWELVQGRGEGAAQANSQQGGEDFTNVTNSSPGSLSNFIDSTRLMPNTDYILIVGARNAQGGRPVFQAVSGIRYIDLNGPKITSIQTSQSGSQSNTFTGTVTVRFDKTLHVYNNGTLEQYTPSGTDVTLSTPGNAFIRPNGSSSQMLSIYCTNVPADALLELKPDFYSREANGRDHIFLRLEQQVDTQNNITVWQFVIDGGLYDGQTSETIPIN